MVSRMYTARDTQHLTPVIKTFNTRIGPQLSKVCTWQSELGKWNFLGSKFGTFYGGHMSPLRVIEQFETWPGKNFRQRIWARRSCQTHCNIYVLCACP